MITIEGGTIASSEGVFVKLSEEGDSLEVELPSGVKLWFTGSRWAMVPADKEEKRG